MQPQQQEQRANELAPDEDIRYYLGGLWSQADVETLMKMPDICRKVKVAAVAAEMLDGARVICESVGIDFLSYGLLWTGEHIDGRDSTDGNSIAGSNPDYTNIEIMADTLKNWAVADDHILYEIMDAQKRGDLHARIDRPADEPSPVDRALELLRHDTPQHIWEQYIARAEDELLADEAAHEAGVESPQQNDDHGLADYLREFPDEHGELASPAREAHTVNRAIDFLQED